MWKSSGCFYDAHSIPQRYSVLCNFSLKAFNFEYSSLLLATALRIERTGAVESSGTTHCFDFRHLTKKDPNQIIYSYTTMYANNDNDILCCPYNKLHRIPESRFQRHLVKCEKNFPPDYKVICPYNATHRLSKNEIEEHIKTCPMRRTVEGSYIQPPSRTIRHGHNDSTSNFSSYWGSEEDM